MTPQELKNSILQLAIQGRLVEQRPEEGTAEELYRQIQREKAALVKVGMIKKEKPLPEITEEEVPFEIPEGWKWVRLGDCSTYAQSKEKIASTDITDLMWSLDLEDIEKETGNIINRCSAGSRKITGDKVVFHKGQILYSKLRPYLKKILIAPDDGICTPELVPFNVYGGILPEYVATVLRAPHVDFLINSVTYGVKMPRVGTETMVNLLVPLPPLAEQKRIVAKIEELLPYIDRYEKAWSRLEDFNKRFPTDMQKSILQLAIQGKLVPQRPEEGTGEALYRQIQAEKQSLIRSGKLKKEKPLPEITPDEIPFDIPESWKWLRIGDVTQFLSGFAFKSSDFKSEGKYRLFRGINLGVNQIRWDDTVYVDETSDRLSEYILMPGDVLLGLDRPWISDGIRVAIWTEAMDTYLVQRVLRIRATCGITNHYIALLLRSSLLKEALIGKTTGISVPHISPGQVANVVVPLPPLAEQKRIVAKLEELLPLCERLK